MLSQPTPADRIALLVCLIMGSSAAASVARLPTWSLGEVNVLGSALGVAPGVRSILIALLVVLAAVGMEDVLRSAPALANVSLRYTATCWILPCLVTMAAATALPALAGSPVDWLMSLLLLTGLLVAVVVGTYLAAVPGMPHPQAARLLIHVTAYGAAFALYATIYDWGVRGLLSGTAVLLVTFPLALELLRSTEEQVATTWLYAAVVSLITAELMWAVNAWRLPALSGGALLLLAFYSQVGISQQALAGRLSRRVVREFVAVALCGWAVILASSVILVRP